MSTPTLKPIILVRAAQPGDIEWQQRYVRFGMFADVPYGDAVTYYRIVPTEFTNPPTVTL